MATQDVVVDSVTPTAGTWTNLTVAALSAVDTSRASAITGGAYLASITDPPPDFDTLTSLAVRIHWRISAAANKAKSIQVALWVNGTQLSGGAASQSTPTQAVANVDRDDTLTFSNFALTRQEMMALELRFLNQEGGGMNDASAVQIQHNRVDAILTYEPAAANFDASFAGAVPLQSLAASVDFAGLAQPPGPITDLALVGSSITWTPAQHAASHRIEYIKVS